VEKGTVHLEEGPELKSVKLSKTLKNCKEIICYVATLGDGVEGEVKRLMDDNHLAEAYILDAMASVAADNMVTMFHQRMKDVYKNQSKQVTLCFSPGYCDWPITDQKKLFGIFNSNELEVELTDSCFMQPRKSISGVFGITPSDPNPKEQSYNPCLECDRHSCSARRV
jgi:cobalamin-dependent methionine synthase I